MRVHKHVNAQVIKKKQNYLKQKSELVFTSDDFIFLLVFFRKAFFFFPFSGFLWQPVLLCPLWPHMLQVILVPCFDIFFPFGASPSSLFLSLFLGLPGILTYPGACGLGLSEIGHLSCPSTGSKQCSYIFLNCSTE
uniref:Uncharacterized protein n=1 Tax=Triticum urartu TaxID=4572 RepID=A0A8R7QWS2_TRIUA